MNTAYMEPFFSVAVKLASKFCEKELCYDFTVPFVRYVVMHYDEISFPFQMSSNSADWACGPSLEGL